jgi:hypothetical protein
MVGVLLLPAELERGDAQVWEGSGASDASILVSAQELAANCRGQALGGELAHGSLAGGARRTSAGLALKPPTRKVAMILRCCE